MTGGPVSAIPNHTTRIRILLDNVAYNASLETDFAEALVQFLWLY